MPKDTIFKILAQGLKEYSPKVMPELNRHQLKEIKREIDNLSLLYYEEGIGEADYQRELKELSIEIGLDEKTTRIAIARLWLSCYEDYDASTLGLLQNRNWEAFLRENDRARLILPKSEVCNQLIRRPILKFIIFPILPYRNVPFQIENEFLS